MLCDVINPRLFLPTVDSYGGEEGAGCVERFHDEIFFTSFQGRHEYVEWFRLCFTLNSLVIRDSFSPYVQVGGRAGRYCDLLILFHFTRSRYRCSRDWEDNM